MDKPTRCLAMTIDDEMITQVINHMNELMPKTDHREWQFTPENFHFTNDAAIHQILQRLIFLFTENHPSKDMFVDMSLKELIIRVLQTGSAKSITIKPYRSSNLIDSLLSFVLFAKI